MPKADISQLQDEIRMGKLRSVYLIAGPELFLKCTAVEDIQRALQKKDRELQVDRFDAHHIDEAIRDAETVPMWSQLKLVIVSELQEAKAAQTAMLAEYLKNPSPFSTMILVGDKVDGRQSFVKSIEADGIWIECKALYQRQVPEWIGTRMKNRGKHISHQAASFMSDWMGSELAELNDAIEKIILFVGDKPQIDVADIESVLTQTGKKSIFDLTKAIGDRQTALACGMLENLIANHEPPVMILTMISRHWRLLVKTRELKGVPQEKIAKILKVHPFFVKEYIQQSQMYSENELKKGFILLAETDRSLKSSRINPGYTMRNLVVEMTAIKKGSLQPVPNAM